MNSTSAVIDARPPLPLAPLRAGDVVAEPRIAPKRERIRAEQLGRRSRPRRTRHSLHDRHDGDEEHHADGDAEQREEALRSFCTRICRARDGLLRGMHGIRRSCSTGSAPGIARRDYMSSLGLARTASRARSARRVAALLVPQRLHRIQPRALNAGAAEHHARHRARAQRGHDRERRDRRVDRRVREGWPTRGRR